MSKLKYCLFYPKNGEKCRSTGMERGFFIGKFPNSTPEFRAQTEGSPII